MTASGHPGIWFRSPGDVTRCSVPVPDFGSNLDSATNGDVPSGKHTENYGTIHHAINGKTQLFRLGHGFNNELLVYQRVIWCNMMYVIFLPSKKTRNNAGGRMICHDPLMLSRGNHPQLDPNIFLSDSGITYFAENLYENWQFFPKVRWLFVTTYFTLRLQTLLVDSKHSRTGLIYTDIVLLWFPMAQQDSRI